MTPPYAARFWAKVAKGPADECWRWTGAYSEKRHFPPRPVFWLANLYENGRRVGQVIVPAARVALHLTDGIPLGERASLYACHRQSCANPSCVNPRHLYWGTAEENRWDRYGKSTVDPQQWIERLRAGATLALVGLVLWPAALVAQRVRGQASPPPCPAFATLPKGSSLVLPKSLTPPPGFVLVGELPGFGLLYWKR